MSLKSVGSMMLICLLHSTFAMFPKDSSVIELNESNFKTRVLNGHSIWLIAFCRPGSEPCKQLVAEYSLAAKVLKGIARVGVVNMDVYASVGAQFDVTGFPTILMFGGRDKTKPINLTRGLRTAASLAYAVYAEVRLTITERMHGDASWSEGPSALPKRAKEESETKKEL